MKLSPINKLYFVVVWHNKIQFLGTSYEVIMTRVQEEAPQSKSEFIGLAIYKCWTSHYTHAAQTVSMSYQLQISEEVIRNAKLLR